MFSVILLAVNFVSAAESADVSVSPEGWLKPSVSTQYNFTVAGTGTTDIDTVRITKPTGYPDITSCDVAPTGWDLGTEGVYYCEYYTITSPIAIGDTKTFSLTITNPTFGSYTWQVKGNGAVISTPTTTIRTIQSAINSWEEGDDPIEIPAGTYVEDLKIFDNKTGLELIGADKTTTEIKGIANEPVASGNLAVPNIEILADNVKIHGFTIEGPDYVAEKYVSGMLIDGKNVEIYDNNFVATKAETEGELAHAVMTYSKTAIPTADVSGLHIHNNTFTGSGAVGLEAIYINPQTGTGTITIEDNEFSGAINIGITVESGNAIVSGNTIETTLNYETNPYGTYGIRFFDSTYAGSFEDITISNNEVQSFNRAIRVGNGLNGPNNDGTSTTSITADILSNTLTDNNVAIWARQYGVAILNATKNLMTGNTLGVDNDGSVEVSAENNYWGTSSRDAIEALIEGSVDFVPWWYDETGSTTDETAPTITFSGTPYSGNPGEEIPINITITDDSGIDSYTINFDGGHLPGEETTEIVNEDAGESTSIILDDISIVYETPEEYTITVTTTDIYGNEAIKAVGVSVYESPDWEIDLKTGQANFIAIPFTPQNTDYKVVLESIKGNLEKAWGYVYNEETGENAWVWMTGGTSWSRSTAFEGWSGEVVPGRGYIVFVSNDDVLYGYKKTASGNPDNTPVTPASVKLANGYNLIGLFGNNTTTTVDTALASLRSLTDGRYWHKVLDKNEAEVTENLTANTAYWVSMKHLPDTATDDYYTYYI